LVWAYTAVARTAATKTDFAETMFAA
jgi:hypothetical protein